MPIKITGVDAVIAKMNEFGKGLTQKEAKEAGEATISAMKSLIARGVSPILGGPSGTRFAAYKHPSKYPGNKKPHSPVNLFLSGNFLDSLSVRIVQETLGWGFQIRFDGRTNAKKMEEGHRVGWNGQPKRPIIPEPGNGEKFAQTVQLAYTKVILDALKKFVG